MENEIGFIFCNDEVDFSFWINNEWRESPKTEIFQINCLFGFD